MAAPACGGGPSPRPIIRFAYPFDPPTLDPLARGGGAAATRDLLRPVLPSLFALDSQGRPRPDLVRAWPRPTAFRFDPFSVELELRRATWSDGVPISSSDLRFSFERLRRGPTGARYAHLVTVDVFGPRRFRLRFDEPVRRWWALFSLDDMVLPAHAYSPAWKDGPTVSGGPFEWGGWRPGLGARLVPNPRYWGRPPRLAEIDLLFVPDDETRLELLALGRIDAFWSPGDPAMEARARARGWPPAKGTIDGRGGSSGWWGEMWWELDLDPSRLGDGVRRAIVEALDPSLAAEALEGAARSAVGIPPALGRRAAPVWGRRGDLERARALLGGRPPPPFVLAYPAGSGGAALASYIHERLGRMGIGVQPAAIDPADFELSPTAGGRAAALLRLRRAADGPDASVYGLAEEVARPAELVRGPLVGLDPSEWTRAERALAGRATVDPLVFVRTWIVARPGPAGLAAREPGGPLAGAAGWNVAAG